jgi:hypothetical protein
MGLQSKATFTETSEVFSPKIWEDTRKTVQISATFSRVTTRILTVKVAVTSGDWLATRGKRIAV